MKHYLYRHFDHNGVLLYVGISLSTVQRLGQHRDHSHWFDAIVRVEIESFETRAAALDAEREAIRAEHPLCNIAHSQGNVVALNTAANRRAVESRLSLEKRVIDFRPTYAITDAAQALGIQEATVRLWLDQGVLGYVDLPTASGKPRRKILGWQLIDFLEFWQATSSSKAKASVRNTAAG